MLPEDVSNPRRMHDHGREASRRLDVGMRPHELMTRAELPMDRQSHEVPEARRMGKLHAWVVDPREDLHIG